MGVPACSLQLWLLLHSMACVVHTRRACYDRMVAHVLVQAAAAKVCHTGLLSTAAPHLARPISARGNRQSCTCVWTALAAGTGLPLYITEFSLFSNWTGPNGNPISYLDEDTQANTTEALLRLFFGHPAVKGVILWGWWDANLYIENCGIYRADKTPKKAGLALRRLWEEEWSTDVAVADPGPRHTFTGYYGTYSYSYEARTGGEHKGTVHFGRGRRRRVANLGGKTAATPANRKAVTLTELQVDSA